MWGRALAGLIPGFFLAAALTGLVCWLPPGEWQSAVVPSMIAFIPIWMGVATAAFSFRSARRAWIGLSVLAAMGFATLWALRATALVH